MTEEYYLGLDLGQSQDYTAITILEKEPQSEDTPSNYRIRYLERPQLGTPYPDIVEKVSKMLNSDQLKDKATLVVDQTGCGRPVFDLFEKAGLNPIGISIHGGDAVTHEGSSWRVPKRDLVACLQVLLQNERLKVSKKLKLEQVLSREMLNFKVKIDPKTAHDSYSAWREGDHDDLVLAVAMAAWCGEYGPTPGGWNFAAAPVISYSDHYRGPY
jgi:hypothetical protein